MIWVTIIMGLLSLLLTWLMNRKSVMLGDHDRQRLNGLIFRARQVEEAAVSVGCKAGGEELKEEGALPAEPEALRLAILAGIGKALSHTLIVSGDNRQLLEAMRAYWTQATAVELYKLITLLPQGESDGS